LHVKTINAFRRSSINVTNAAVLNRTGEESIISRIRRRRMAVFGHKGRLPEQVPAHAVLRLAVDTRTGRKPDNGRQWRRPRGRPRHTWIWQIEADSGLSANAAWDAADDRCRWTEQRP